ncbi:MAG: hypothetical protein A2284_01765 [Deltaproteobacteria bacterium RIFOXYA12_FULL_61_11]|nr:MAG: hypothetical protein A2284_01765 [Deltaproteobacteria bacterium RIFOXYA12_FULL_61_11]
MSSAEQPDLLLLHPPAVLDFRRRDDILFACLSDGDAVSVSPIFEMHPIGFHAIAAGLARHGFRTTILNLATRMLCEPGLDLPGLLRTCRPRLFGVGFQWLAHAQGVLALCELLAELHPDIPLVVGGLAATHLRDELLGRTGISYVLAGLDPIPGLAALLGRGRLDLALGLRGPGAGDGTLPRIRCYDAELDWTSVAPEVNFFLTLSGVGCEYSCGYCGGGRAAAAKHLGVEAGFAPKARPAFLRELASIAAHPAKRKRVVALQHWFEDKDLLAAVLPVLESGDVRTLHLTVHRLLSEEHLRLLGRSSVRPLLEVTLDSHDPRIRALCGRGEYGERELEAWLDQVFSLVPGAVVEIYLMLGLPYQTEAGALAEAGYGRVLLERHAGRPLDVFLCPMRPFLDPGSVFHDQPEKFGYRLFYRDLDGYARALTRLHWRDGLNYETRWLSRERFVPTCYRAAAAMVEHKVATGRLPTAIAGERLEFLRRTEDLLDRLDGLTPETLGEKLRREVRTYNDQVFAGHALRRDGGPGRLYRYWFETR